MKNPGFGLREWGVFLLAVLLVSASHAQVYKWVDAKGQTHYSSRKDDAGSAKTNEVKLPPQPSPPAIPNPAADAGKFPPPPAPEVQASGPAAPKPPRSLSGGKEDGTDASRCNLARDVLNGSVRHRNGKPIDKYDTDTAQSDIRLFCR